MIARLILGAAIAFGLAGGAMAHPPGKGHVHGSVPVGVWLSPPHSTGFWDSWTKAPRAPGAGCFVRGALWSLGWAATPLIVERARAGAAARLVRVSPLGEVTAVQHIPHRLTLEADKRNIIRAIRCG